MKQGTWIPRRRVVCAAVLAVAASAGLLGGCGPKTVTLDVPVHVEKGKIDAACFNWEIEPEGCFAKAEYMRAFEARKDRVTVTAPAGTVMWAFFTNDRGDSLGFPFVLEEKDAGRIELGRLPGMAVGTLNYKPVFADLGESNALNWFTTAKETEIASIRAIVLSGIEQHDVAALKRLAGRPLAVVLSRHLSPPGYHAKVLDALEQARPLVVASGGNSEADREFAFGDGLARLARVPSLVALQIGCEKIPDLSGLTQLRTLKLQIEGQVGVSLQPLTALASLENLELSCPGVEDLSPLARMKGLRSLMVAECPSLTNLKDIQGLSGLTTLVLSDPNLRDLRGMEKLGNLRRLALIPLPPKGTDFTPMYKLQKLEVLLLIDSDANGRPEEVSAIRQAMPNVRIETFGICMGSAWAMLVPLAGAAAGAAMRFGRARHARRAGRAWRSRRDGGNVERAA